MASICRGTWSAAAAAIHLTFSGNSAVDAGSDLSSRYVSAIRFLGSILSRSTAEGNCYEESGLQAGFIFDNGYNISEDVACIDESTSFAADPLLGPLQDNGGSTHTHAPLEGSPAIDAIPLEVECTVTEDQRGVARPQGEGCDIGAYEVESVPSAQFKFLPLVIKQ